MGKYEEKVIVKNKLGMHLRSAGLFVETSSKFRSEIHLAKDENKVNGKSIMGILMLAAARGSELVISAEGTDAKIAVKVLVKLVEDKFHEEE